MNKSISEKKIEQMIDAALKARKLAYTPYSHYMVGAALLVCDGTEDNKIITGCNIENAAYSPGNCAERTAIFATYANGYRKEDVVALAIVSNGERLAAPCGICRQVLSELIDLDTPIYLSNKLDEKTVTIRELLPMNFEMKDVIR